MNLMYEERIIGDHPVIYRKLKSRVPSGERFECGDGWRTLLEELSNALETVARQHPDEPFAVTQLKEKFASLRVHISGLTPPPVAALVDAAYERSLITCEFCGNPGFLRTDRVHMRTLCDQCAV